MYDQIYIVLGVLYVPERRYHAILLRSRGYILAHYRIIQICFTNKIKESLTVGEGHEKRHSQSCTY
jgi:hypothetical protein